MLNESELSEQIESAQTPVEHAAPTAKSRSRVFVGAGVLLLFLVAVGGGMSLGGWVIAKEADVLQFPDWVYSSALSLDGYKAAVEMGGSLESLPCYCDCGEASEHKSLLDCYFKDDGEFNDHASACDVCGQEAVDSLAWRKSGLDIKQIRAEIDSKYRSYGTPTDTPLPL